MCLLDRVRHWSDMALVAEARSHLDADNPLRRGGRLAPVCGIEYGLQAAALHGALCDGLLERGERQAPGYLASLRSVSFTIDRLDDPALGTLAVTATLAARESRGLLYDFALAAEDGRALLHGRAAIALPGAA